MQTVHSHVLKQLTLSHGGKSCLQGQQLPSIVALHPLHATAAAFCEIVR